MTQAKTETNGAPWRDRETLERLYVEERLPQQKVAERLGCSRKTVQRWMGRYGIESRSIGESNAIAAQLEPPGFYMTTGGYIIVSNSYKGEERTFMLHRLVAVAEYGFDAVADMEVHHKNGVPWDNRPDNLELIDETGHLLLHKRGYNSSDELPDSYPWHNKELLKSMYYGRGLTTVEIANRLDCNEKAIRYWMDKYGFERRPPDAKSLT